MQELRMFRGGKYSTVMCEMCMLKKKEKTKNTFSEWWSRKKETLLGQINGLIMHNA